MKIDHVWNWPIGNISSAAFVYVFWHSRLYLNSLLQIFYVVVGFIGWYWWLRGGERKTRRQISRLTVRGALVALALTGAGTVVMWDMESHFTSSASPFYDALVVALSLTAQFVLTGKWLEHWWIWILVDIIGTVLFWNEGLQLTSILYVIYGSICVRGLFTWRRMYNAEQGTITPQLQERIV